MWQQFFDQLFKEHLLAGLLERQIEGQSDLFYAMYFIVTRCFCQHISWEVMRSFPKAVEVVEAQRPWSLRLTEISPIPLS